MKRNKNIVAILLILSSLFPVQAMTTSLSSKPTTWGAYFNSFNPILAMARGWGQMSPTAQRAAIAVTTVGLPALYLAYRAYYNQPTLQPALDTLKQNLEKQNALKEKLNNIETLPQLLEIEQQLEQLKALDEKTKNRIAHLKRNFELPRNAEASSSSAETPRIIQPSPTLGAKEAEKEEEIKSERIHPVEGLYPITEQMVIKTKQFPDLIVHIINFNAIELSGSRCEVTKQVHMSMGDYDNLMAIYGSLPPDLDTIPKEQKMKTLCNGLMVQRQEGNECGLMGIYNALQLYSLLNNSINKATFEENLKKFNLVDWETEVESCPIDISDIIKVMAKRLPHITKDQYTIIPTIVDDNGQLSYIPLKQKTIVTHNGEISANFDQDISLLRTIERMHDARVKKYTHIFFLNNLQIGAQGASMRHWIPVVLHKEHNQIYLYTINSQSVFYENLMDTNDKVVNIEMLEQIVHKDMSWVRALIQLLTLNPEVLARAIALAESIQVGEDYNHDFVPDILHAIRDDNSEIADDIRRMLELSF